MIENQSRNEKKRKKKKKGREKEKRGERKKAILLLWLRNSRFQRRVISWSAILTSSWMRHNDENTGVLVNCCQLGNNDVVDASWRKYVARPLHFFSPPSLFFAKSHWKPGRTGISFAIIRAQFTRGNLETVFLRDAAGWLFPYFAFFLPVPLLRPTGWMSEMCVGGGFSSRVQWYIREIVILMVIWEFFISVKISS